MHWTSFECFCSLQIPLSIVEIPIVFSCLNVFVTLNFMLEVCYLNVLVLVIFIVEACCVTPIDIQTSSSSSFTFVRVRCFQTLSIAILAAQQLSFCFPSSLCALNRSKIFALLLCIFFQFTSPTFALFTNCSFMFLPSSSIIVKRCLQITLYFPIFI